jgi:hypothetical protein
MNMSSLEYALVTFGAAFSGAIFSLLLWFGIDAWIRRKRNKKTLEAMMKEILEELQFDIALLMQLPENLRQALDSSNVPLKISRLRYSAANYAISSGEIRLTYNIRKQRLIRYIATVYETFNEFVDNTERLLAILVLKEDGLVWSRYRIDRLVEQATSTKALLEDYNTKLQREDLTDEYEEEMMTTRANNDAESNEMRLSKIEEGINEIKKQLKDNEKTSKFHSGLGVGIAAIAIATGFAAAWSGWATTGVDLPSVALVISIGGILIIVTSIWEYRGLYRRKLGIGGLLTTFVGALLVVSPLLLDFTIMPFLKLFGLIVIVIGLYLLIFSVKLQR